MKLQSRVLIPILSVLILSLVLISVTSVSVMNDTTRTTVESEMRHVADAVSHQIILSENITNSTLDMMNQKNIVLAQALATIIAEEPDNLQNENMARLCTLLQVSEVHVTDENGILSWGSMPDFFGLDFSTNDQTRPLLAILDDPSLVIAQEPQPRAIDGTLFQYISVSRIDKPGIVQVGVEMKVIDDVKASLSVQNAIIDLRIGQEGGVILLDADKQVVADSTGNLLGTDNSGNLIGADLSSQRWVIEMFSLKEGIMRYSYEHTEYKSYYRMENDYMIVTFIPQSEMDAYTLRILASIVPLGVVTALIVSLIAVWLIRWITKKAYWYESIIDCMPFLVSVTDTKMNMTFVNKPVEEFLQKKRSELLSKPCNSWDIAICNTDDCTVNCLEHNRPTSTFHQNGIDFKVDASYLTDRKNRKVGQIEILQDVSELLMLQKQLEAALEKANEASKAKSNFLANMSHEIRTPMNAIIGMTNIAKASDDLERKDYSLARIEDASNHLLGVINDILDISKIESGRFDLSDAEFSFEQLLKRVVNVSTFRVDEKRQKLTVYVDRTIPHYLFGDDQRLAQVMTNLLGNAVKFTPEEGTIRLNTFLLGEKDGLCEIKISITDSGIGIDKEQQVKLFESFQQAENDTTRKFGGTGLGLSISKSIVELMGGSLWVESDLGKGSMFAFTFKMERREDKDDDSNKKQIDWKNLRVLVVDDDRYILQDFKGIIEKLGAQCDIAQSGAEALEIHEKNGDYNLYFVDWMMPGMDGFELTEELKRRMKDAKDSFVIMVSATEYSQLADRMDEVGVDNFLQKPLFSSNIEELVGQYFGITEPLSNEDEEEEDISGIFAGRRILLVEDVEINREIVIALLEPTLLKIDSAENGRVALNMFSAAPEKFDMIFMDIQMPEMDGYEATRRIRALGFPKAKTIPIIATTANVFKEDIEKCLAAGMNAHVGKPLDIMEAIDKMREFLPG